MMAIAMSCLQGAEVPDDSTATIGPVTRPTDAMDTSVEKSICGDGVVDPHLEEECDDGERVSGDGCDAECRWEPRDVFVRGRGSQPANAGLQVTCDGDEDSLDGWVEVKVGANLQCMPDANLLVICGTSDPTHRVASIADVEDTEPPPCDESIECAVEFEVLGTDPSPMDLVCTFAER